MSPSFMRVARGFISNDGQRAQPRTFERGQAGDLVPVARWTPPTSEPHQGGQSEMPSQRTLWYSQSKPPCKRTPKDRESVFASVLGSLRTTPNSNDWLSGEG